MAVSKKVLLIIGVFVAAAMIIVAAASLNGNENDAVDVNDNADDEGITENIDVEDNTTVGQASNSQMTIVVNEILFLNGSASSTFEIYQDPTEGNQYVILNVSITNNLGEGLSITSESWNLYDTDEMMNTITANVANEVPEEIPAGGSVTFYMPFEIVGGSTPTMLECTGGMETLTVEFD